MPRTDATYEGLEPRRGCRAVLLPALFFVIAVAIVCGLVLSGAVQGHKTYEAPTRRPPTHDPDGPADHDAISHGERSAECDEASALSKPESSVVGAGASSERLASVPRR